MSAPFTASLRALHGDADPSLSALFGHSPSIVSWRRGDPKKTPQGTFLSGTREHSYWSCRLERLDGESVEEFLKRWSMNFQIKNLVLRALRVLDGVSMCT